MFKKVFEYAGPHKKDLYSATFIVLLSVLMGVLPFVLAYQVISPLVMGETVGSGYVSSRVIGILVCLVLQAALYGWGLNVSHKAAYNTLLRLRTALQKRFESLPLGFIQDKGTGTVKKLFVDDVDSLEVLLAHSLPEGIANLMIPLAIYAPIVILDEATASVDTDNESYIQQAISELVKGKTLLVIAHRLNTIKSADQILVIADGRICQKGTHEELESQPGIYQDFINIRRCSSGWSLE